MNEKAQKTVDTAVELLGSPYVFGMWGGKCTPENRRKYSGYNPSHEAAIRKNCQVLNGSAASCAGCKYEGRLAFDCRGFTHYLLLQVGIDISGSGATSQYNTASNWAQRGTIDELPDLPCCLFQQVSGTKTMQHTGYHIGGGQIIHCSAGVQRGKTSDRGWTHYAVPFGLYSEEELASAGVVITRPVLRAGMKGAAVELLQFCLADEGYDPGKQDGTFGSLTEAAVRRYQADNGLTVDGIVGAKTWAALLDGTKESGAVATGCENATENDEETATGCESKTEVEEVHIITRITDEAGRTFDPVGRFTVEVLLLNQDGEVIGEKAND